MKTKKGNVAMIAIIIVIVSITAGVIGFLFAKKTQAPERQANVQQPIAVQQPTQTQAAPVVQQSEAGETASWKTYTNEKYGFSFKYPQGWFVDGKRLSPQKIEDYQIGSDNAAVHFGVYTKNQDVFLNSPGSSSNPEIGDFGDFDYQIKSDKRNSSDSVVQINGLAFNRYDLVDYGQNEGSSSGNIILLVSPKLQNQDLFVVFEWQQFPGGKTLKVNQSKDFNGIVSTFKFTK